MTPETDRPSERKRSTPAVWWHRSVVEAVAFGVGAGLMSGLCLLVAWALGFTR